MNVSCPPDGQTIDFHGWKCIPNDQMEFILNYKLGFFFVKFDGEIIFVCDSKVIFLKW